MWLCARGNCGCHQDKGHAVECVVVWSFHELADWVGLRDLNYHCGWATPFLVGLSPKAEKEVTAEKSFRPYYLFCQEISQAFWLRSTQAFVFVYK